MKKLFICIISATAAVAIFSACTAQSFVPERDENSALEFWLTDDVLQVDLSGYEFVPGWFGAEEFYNAELYPTVTNEDGEPAAPEICVKYLITAYPDYADGGSFITHIEITDPEVEIYGVNCQSTLEQFDSVFTQKGYTVTATTSTLHVAEREGFRFSLWREGDEGKLQANAKVTNRDSIVF